MPPAAPARTHSGILETVCLMRWLLIVLLVSLAAMLAVSAGVAHHIRRQRTRYGSESSAAPEPVEEADLKFKR
jgi:uncharacterized membrane protein